MSKLIQPKYTFAVIVETQHDWRNWVSNKVYGSHTTTQITSNNFILRDIKYVKIQNEIDLRGWRFDGVITTDNAQYNSNYDLILSLVETCLL